MIKQVKTQFGTFNCEYVGYKGTRTFRHYLIYSNLKNSHTPTVQVYGKTRKQAITMFEEQCANGNFDYDFQKYKTELCKDIYTSDVCCDNKKLADNTFNYENCKRPPYGVPDLLYLISTAPTILHIEQIKKNYKGYSRYLESIRQNRKEK